MISAQKHALCPEAGTLPKTGLFALPKIGHFAPEVGALPKKWLFAPKRGLSVHKSSVLPKYECTLPKTRRPAQKAGASLRTGLFALPKIGHFTQNQALYQKIIHFAQKAGGLPKPGLLTPKSKFRAQKPGALPKNWVPHFAQNRALYPKKCVFRPKVASFIPKAAVLRKSSHFYPQISIFAPKPPIFAPKLHLVSKVHHGSVGTAVT